MLLNDIGKLPTSTFRKINHHLETNYGFKIAEDVSDKDLVAIMETIEEEITELKIKGDDTKASPEISKRLLVLEGIKQLREFALVQFQSPDLDRVVDGLVDFVHDSFRLGGTTHEDFDDCVNDGMKHYRSSKYRFPDDIIEQRVRQAVMSRLRGMSPEPSIVEMDVEGPIIGETLPNDKQDEMSGEELPVVMEYKETPNVEQEVAFKKGTVMKENLVRNLRRLLETEVSQAEVMMAAKGFAQELQEMIEKIGRLQNEDLPPVTDQMRETYGTDSSSAFQTQIYGALQGVMDSLYTAKGQVDDAVSNMAATGQVSAETDMDIPMDGMGDMDATAELDADLDNIAGDELANDEFGGAEEEEPLGRSMKAESVEQLQRKINEMKKLVNKAKKLKEAKK